MKSCHYCGDPIHTEEWYPVTLPDDREGTLPFCSDECLEQWERRSDADVAGTSRSEKYGEDTGQ